MKRLIILNENLRLIFHRLIRNTKVDNLHYFRILIGSIFIGRIKNLSFLSELPHSLFRPNILNFTNLFDAWPSVLFFSSLFYLNILLGVCVIIGIKTRIAFILIGIIALIENGFLYSFGKIDHGILLNTIPFVMAFTNCGTKKALVPDKIVKSESLAIAILAIFVVFGFFTAGLEKAFVWVDFDIYSSGFLSWFYASYYSIGRTELLAPMVLHFPWWLTEIMDYTAVLFELSGIIFLLINRKIWYTYLFIACIFHLLNTLFLNIGFEIHIIIFATWLITPFLARFKALIIIFPILLFFDAVIFNLIAWLLTIGLGVYGFMNHCYWPKTERKLTNINNS